MQFRAIVTWSTAAAVVVGAVVIAETAGSRETWVVEQTSSSRNTRGETYSVICVPRLDLDLPFAERTWREVEVSRATFQAAREGDECPTGAVLGESR